MNSKSVASPTIIRRKLNGLTIEATPFGDGRVGFYVEGPPAALASIASGLVKAGWSVEYDDKVPNSFYAEGRGEAPKEMVEIPALDIDLTDIADKPEDVDAEAITQRYPAKWRESGPSLEEVGA